jgi:hypothetical protein
MKQNKNTIKYFAYAVNAQGKIEQLLIVRKNGKQVSQVWQGKTYLTTEEANRDMIRLNCSNKEVGQIKIEPKQETKEKGV